MSALALESPDVIGSLVEAVVAGKAELVGGAYAAINGLLASGETNLRNHRMGALTLLRLACSPALTYWQSHFDAFPQTPQVLATCGIESIVLVHRQGGSTPEVPCENEALVAWHGVDGSTLTTLTRTRSTAATSSEYANLVERAKDSPACTKAALAWLPWGDDPRSVRTRESVRDQLASLASDDDFGLALPRKIVMTLRSRAANGQLESTAYSGSTLWHGQSIGINGDRILRSCARLERDILAVEALSAMQPFLGKNDAWGEYPHWELDEAWRGLLVAQHSEVREREGSLGGIALADATRAQSLIDDVRTRIETRLARRCPSQREGSVVINSLGWQRDVRLGDGQSETVPAFGWLALPHTTSDAITGARASRLRLAPEDDTLVVSAAGLRIKLHRRRGVITQIFSDAFPQGMLAPKQELLAFELRNDRGVERFEESVEVRSDIFGIKLERHGKRGRLDLRLEVLENPSRIVIHVEGHDLPRPGCRPDVDDEYGDADGASWARDALTMPIVTNLGASMIRIHDTPYCVDVVDPRIARTRRYPGPGGSGPVEEKIRAPFTASSLVDLVDSRSGRGLLYVHDGGQAFFAEQDGARAVLSMWEPNCGGPWIGEFKGSFALVPHQSMTHENRLRIATEHRTELRVISGAPGDGQLPDRFGGIHLEGEHAILTAFFREEARHTQLLMASIDPAAADVPTGIECAAPWVARIVEVDGVGGVVSVVFPNPVQSVIRSSALGGAIEELPADPRRRNAVLLELRPREIATIRFRLS